jgi:predicted alpha-1,2-mannosidase
MKHPFTQRANSRIQQIRKPHARVLWLVLLLLPMLPLNAALAQNASPQPDPASSVHPLIGTGGDPQDGINLFPGATVPFGMVQLSPDTEDHGFGYHYIQKWLKGFSMIHMSGVGCADEGDVFFTATTGPIVTKVNDYQTPFSHQQETASPGYYRVQLLQWGINAELTATERTGVARFTFPADKDANILVPISHTLNDVAATSIHVVGDRRIEGFVEEHAFCSNKPKFKVYFAMLFDHPFTSYGTWKGDEYDGLGNVVPQSRATGQDTHQATTGAYATWAAQKQQQIITAKIGISYADAAGAEKNLAAESEATDFSAIRRNAQRAWSKALSTIEVSRGSPARQAVFYTALYHSLLMPSLFDDVDGRYLGFDGKLHTVAPGHHVYANFSGWDIYRSELPLLSLIEPQRMQDMAQSVVLMYEQGGWMPRWPQVNFYTNDMVGSPLTIALATAWLDGLHGFDIDTAWEGMLKDATQPPSPGSPALGEEGMTWLNTLHYVPADKITYGSVGKTLEYSLAYASLYRLALALHKPAEARSMYDRALFYRNLFNPEDGLFRPRNADGSWVPDFNPSLDSHGFVEGTGWHYQTFAPADLAWLINAVGRQHFNDRTTEFFHYPAPGWYAEYYNPYNETDLQAPFVFNFSGQPWKSQSFVRRVLNENYTDTPDGIPGNDDAGAMSSWAVLSMMGIYSVDPSSLAYELVSPVFPRIVVHLHAPYSGSTFTITTTNDPDATPYIQRVQLNGREHARNWIAFHDITDGGKLHFMLGAEPNMHWGAGPMDAPPSISDESALSTGEANAHKQ